MTTRLLAWSIVLLSTAPLPTLSQSSQKTPSLEEVISLAAAGNPLISPDGKLIAYTITRPDWQENRYDSEIWLHKEGASPIQLTRTKAGSSSNPKWSPDGTYLAFTAKRDDKTQLFAISMMGGEAFPITHEKEDIGDFEWAPDGKKLAFTMPQPESKGQKNRKLWYGSYTEDDQEFRQNWLYLIDFDPAPVDPSFFPCFDKKDSTSTSEDCINWPKATPLLEKNALTVLNFKWSPDGKSLAITHAPNPLINSFIDTDISILEVASKKLVPTATHPSTDSFDDWSPDGKYIVYHTDRDDRQSNFYKNDFLIIQELATGKEQPIASDLDVSLNNLHWAPAGIYALGIQKTTRTVFILNPQSGKASKLSGLVPIVNGFSLSADGKSMALIGESGTDLGEVYKTSLSLPKPQKITALSKQIETWSVAQSEVVQWKSEDGATIEGILHKPQGYDPNKKYPLLVMIHGGPTGVDRPTPLPGYVYPVVQWLNKGALVLRPNYRGSEGYGESFRSLNVENLGVGDSWDVLSGIDYLASQNKIDTSRLGVMGWSQGGYISAFLTTTSKRFKAVSVGAGISNWMTYYVNTDIHPFTRQYLKATPWQNEEIYKKTSPMTYIKQAVTPTLIQHGELDPRVPIPNAYELLQGLRDVGVPARLMVYKGFGHGITKPKERLAATWHNWQWFNKYLWGEEVKIPGLD